MPTETAAVVAVITLIFTTFALVLAWADYYSRNSRQPPG